MSERRALPQIDKSAWGDGPWQNEPDRVDWIHAGYACMIRRHPRYGYLCGYVAVDSSHPLYGEDWHAPGVDLNGGHAGVNYSAPCDDGEICHVPAPGMPADVWWFGFDCGHLCDYAPGLAVREREMAKRIPQLADLQRRIEDLTCEHAVLFRDVYRDLPYVRHCVEALARELRTKVT